MTQPLVSVVIPTHNRPQFLGRAIASALAYSGDDVEVIVVPNGPDESWKETLTPWAQDARVRISPIATAHANAARNHGMDMARGKYVRFLDDDDYLLPGAERQITILEGSACDACTGLIRSVDEDDSDLGINYVPATRDFVQAVTFVSGLTLPHASLWCLRAVSGYRWDESVGRAQDNAWMLDLAAAQEWSWARDDNVVGVWFQHKMPRTSTAKRMTWIPREIIDRLALLPTRLLERGGLTNTRRIAIASALWFYIQRAFPSHPIYWARIGREALRIDPGSRPDISFYTTGLFRHINPVTGQWLLLPIRWLTRLTRSVSNLSRERDYRRKL